MSFAVVKWRKLPWYVSRANLGPILSISGVVISLGCVAAGFYLLASITAGANLIATRSAIRRSKKDSFAVDG